MPKFFLFTTLILFLNCERETKDKWYGPEIKFKRTENPNYSHYFPGTSDSGRQNTKKEELDKKTLAEPVPSFTSKSGSDQLDKQEKSSGFFAFLFNDSEDENEQKQSICEEILDINKIVVADQSQKLKVLTSEKENLLSRINRLERELQRISRKDQEHLRRLESEIKKLNGLIKILSTEIK